MSYGVYHCYGGDGQLIYVGCTGNLKARMAGHKCHSRWFPQVARVDFVPCGSRSAALARERQAIETGRPQVNKLHNPRILRAVHINVSLCRGLWEWACQRAKELGLTFSGYISMLIRQSVVSNRKTA